MTTADLINSLNWSKILQKRTRSILTELDELLTHKDKDNLLESRANNIINGAINLIRYIRENYDAEQALELERRLLNAIKGQDPAKFTRGIRKISNED
jgi:hypothetical protein